MRNQQAAVCRTTVVAAVTNWTLVLLGYLGGAGQLWHRDVTLDNAP